MVRKACLVCCDEFGWFNLLCKIFFLSLLLAGLKLCSGASTSLTSLTWLRKPALDASSEIAFSELLLNRGVLASLLLVNVVIAAELNTVHNLWLFGCELRHLVQRFA